MTKKINASTFRLGYNLFWYYKISNVFFPLKFRNIVKISKKRLKKNNYICLNFLFKFNHISILIHVNHKKFKFFANSIRFIKNKVTKTQNYLKSYLNHKKFILCYFRSLNYIQTYIKDYKQIINLHSKTKTKYYLKFTVNYSYLQKLKNQTIILRNFLFETYKWNTNSIDSTLNYFFHSNLYQNLNKEVFPRFTSKTLSKKYYQMLSIKNEEISLELLLNNWFKYRWKIQLNNVFNNLNFNKFLNKFDKNTTSKQNIKQQFKIKRHNLLFYSYFLFKNTELICKHIGSSLLKTNQHVKNVQFLLNRLYYLYSQKILNLKGFKFYLSGKLNGKMKRQKYSYKIRKMLLQTINVRIFYSYFNLYTTFGVFSIKVWLC